MKNKYSRNFDKALIVLLLTFATISIRAQSTAFTYQGKLNDNGVAGNASYDIEFRLFDVASGGASLGVQQKLNVQVTDGVFAVQLDFGAGAFSGPARYIEIAV